MTNNTIMRELNNVDRYSYCLQSRYNKRQNTKRIVVIRIAKKKNGHRKTIIEFSPHWKHLFDSNKIVIVSSPKEEYRFFSSHYINTKFQNISTMTLDNALKMLEGEKRNVE